MFCVSPNHHPEAHDDFRHPTFLCRDTEFCNEVMQDCLQYHEKKGMKGEVQVMVKYTTNCHGDHKLLKRLFSKFQCIIFVVVGIYFKFPGCKNGFPGMMKECIKDWT